MEDDNDGWDQLDPDEPGPDSKVQPNYQAEQFHSAASTWTPQACSL